ncbi:MAG: prephenate dehydratase [Candidatus Omnitrophica bacterium]|nr:prephenate dehydratase [Candidatus Omnitrophota bacterium]
MTLEELRSKIDQLDEKIIRLLNDRTDIALKIGELKKQKGSAIYAPDRESEVYSKIVKMGATGPLSSEALKAVYREIMSASLDLERPLTIAYLGPEATFTHLASISKFGASVQYRPCQNIGDVFLEVEKGNADYGVIPIENSTEGAVNYTLDMFIESDLKICSEIVFDIEHHLMSSHEMKDIKRVYSNPQVFGQCRVWLETHLPRVELIDMMSTTQAAQRAAQESGSAAIASKLAATLYNLQVLASRIQDISGNQTRFLVVGRTISGKTGSDKTSIMVSIKDKMGALYKMLGPIQKYKMNMTKIESRPSKKKAWDYYFFIDFEGHVGDPKVKRMLREMEKTVRFLKVLGSYPCQQKNSDSH